MRCRPCRSTASSGRRRRRQHRLRDRQVHQGPPGGCGRRAEPRRRAATCRLRHHHRQPDHLVRARAERPGASAVAASPDGNRVYVGGDFTTVNGVVRSQIAAFNTATGALITDLRARRNVRRASRRPTTRSTSAATSQRRRPPGTTWPPSGQPTARCRLEPRRRRQGVRRSSLTPDRQQGRRRRPVHDPQRRAGTAWARSTPTTGAVPWAANR